MGFSPPPAGPPPAAPGASVDAGLADSPTAASLCGFKFPPTIFFKFSFRLPSIPFPPPLPSIHISLGINCNLSNPLSVDAGVKWGGGRTSTADPDPDALEQAA